MTGEIKIDKVRREVKLGISKMDFLADNIYIEVKTPLTSLQVDIGDHIKTKKIGKFNSTDRFVKHINELANSLSDHERAILLKPALGVYKLKALSPPTIQEYVNQKFVSGLKKNTLTNIIAVLSGSLKYAVVPAKFIQSSPAEYIRYPKIQTQKSDVNRTVISVEDFNRIIERFPIGNPFHYALMIGFYTGLRIGEVYGLTWDDIDFKEKTLTVNRLVYKRNYGVDVRNVMKQKGKREEKSAWYFGSTKTESSVRTIKIGDTLINSLRKWKTMQSENQLLYGEYYIQHHLKEEKDEKNQSIYRIIPVEKSVSSTLPVANIIMRKENGELSSPDSFKYAARVIHYDLGIKFNFHSLRHTHATMLIEAGISPKSVQERLGHQNIETTLQTYVHDTDVMEQNAVDVFEKVVNRDLPTEMNSVHA